jgi:hypothetical protein
MGAGENFHRPSIQFSASASLTACQHSSLAGTSGSSRAMPNGKPVPPRTGVQFGHRLAMAGDDHGFAFLDPFEEPRQLGFSLITGASAGYGGGVGSAERAAQGEWQGPYRPARP